MKKDKTISLKISSKQYEKLKEIEVKLIDVWEIGFNKVIETYKSELEKKVEKVYTEYIRLKRKLEVFGEKLKSEQEELNYLLRWYQKQNRSIEHPTEQDRQTLQFQMKKRDIHSFTVEQVFDYFKSKKEKGVLNE